MANKRKKISFIIALVLMLSMSVSVFTPMEAFATTYSYTSTKSSYRDWSLNKTTTSTSYTWITKSTKTVTTKKYYVGKTWDTDKKATTANYYHKKGNNDVTASNTKATSHTFNCTLKGEVKGFGASLGYSGSVSSSKTVSQSIPKNNASGYYYHGVKAKVRDLKIQTNVNKYKKKTVNKRTSYYWSSSTSNTQYGVRLYTPGGKSALFYAWYKY